MRHKTAIWLLLPVLLSLALGPVARSQTQQARGPAALWQEPERAVRIGIASDVPLSLIAKDLSKTSIEVLGAVMVIDLNCGLEVRNDSARFLRGVAVGVVTDEHAPGGKASVAIPSLNVPPDGTTQFDIVLKLVRPFPPNSSHAVNLDLDGALFTNLTFRGPDQFDSRRKLLVWELEAERDRRYFKSLLAVGGPEQLEKAMRASVQRQRQRPRLQATLEQQLRKLLTPTLPSAETARRLQLSQHDLRGSPIEIVSGSAFVAGTRVSSPEMRVKNRSQKPVRYYELGWLVRDGEGTNYAAGLMPAPKGQSRLAPGAEASARSERQFVFGRAGADSFVISGMSGYVRNVEFEDGTVWIPPRSELDVSPFENAAAVSVEEERLSRLFGSRGVSALITELATF
ncbi:MAG: hypothetical protein O2968_16115 [Acidobacteria bacterium]|nr:hypothetical protein [Acidobacteriota bacterium]